jgi:LPXTG-motif cell wall-anchored protein
VDRAADPTTGAWSYTPPAPLAPGDHTLSATQTVGGTTSATSATSTFEIIAVPTITAPADGSSTTDTTPTISGTGEPGAEIGVYLDGTYVGAATVGTGGNWSLPVPVPLPAGDYDVSATQTVDGSDADASPTAFTVVATPAITTLVDRSATNPKPVIGGTGEPGAALEVFIDGSSNGTTTVGPGGSWSRPITAPLAIGHHTADATQSIDGTMADARQRRFRVIPGAPLITAPVEGDTTRDPTPTFTGVALPLARVNIVVDGGSTAHVVADSLGQWRFTPTKPLARGDHDVVATQTVNHQTSERSANPAFTILASAALGTSPDGGFSSQGAPAADFSTTGFSSPLPETGAPAGMVWLGVLGMLLVGGGALSVAASRRRRLPAQRAA